MLTLSRRLQGVKFHREVNACWLSVHRDSGRLSSLAVLMARWDNHFFELEFHLRLKPNTETLLIARKCQLGRGLKTGGVLRSAGNQCIFLDAWISSSSRTTRVSQYTKRPIHSWVFSPPSLSLTTRGFERTLVKSHAEFQILKRGGRRPIYCIRTDCIWKGTLLLACREMFRAMKDLKFWIGSSCAHTGRACANHIEIFGMYYSKCD